jgi:hypothetical protein
MLLHDRHVFTVTDYLQQIIVAYEVESRKGSPLRLQIITQRLLNVRQHVDDPGQRLLEALNIHSLNYIWFG